MESSKHISTGTEAGNPVVRRQAPKLTSTMTRMTPEDLLLLSNNNVTVTPTKTPTPTAPACCRRQFVPKTRNSNFDTISEEFEVDPTDNILGRLRKGIDVIQSHARKTIANCETGEFIPFVFRSIDITPSKMLDLPFALQLEKDMSREDMQQRLESSALQMIRAEKSSRNAFRIIAEVVEEFTSADCKENDHKASDNKDTVTATSESIMKIVEPNDDNEKGVGDKDVSITTGKDDDVVPIFRSTILGDPSMRKICKNLTNAMGEKMTAYENGLTDDILRDEKKFKQLSRQINYGKRDAERSALHLDSLDLHPGGEGDMGASTEPLEYTASSESEDDDPNEYLLPTTDPITLRPIHTAMRNKICSHVFDQASISNFMTRNPNSTCPMVGCRNKAVLIKEDFVLEEELTNLIRKKNEKLLGPNSQSGSGNWRPT